MSERQYAERFREEAAQLKQQIKALRERNGELKGLSEEQRDLINSLQDENRDLHQQLDDEEPTSDEDEGLHGVTKNGNGEGGEQPPNEGGGGDDSGKDFLRLRRPKRIPAPPGASVQVIGDVKALVGNIPKLKRPLTVTTLRAWRLKHEE